MAAVALHSAERTFYQVTAESPYMDVLRQIFERILTPLYGSQEDALHKIALGKDRVCYLLYEQEIPIGVIAFKTVLSDEFKDHGIQNSLEIKSLFVVDSEQNSGRGVGTLLLNKVIEEVAQRNLRPEGLHVTVSEVKKESFVFFLKKGFDSRHTWYGKYEKTVLEHLLYCPYRVMVAAKDALDLQPREGSVRGAHWDDIHGLRSLSDGTFISGSKDSSLYKWDREGHLVYAVHEIEPRAIDPKRWTTALGVLNDAYWMSGERTGDICLWTTKGDYVKDLYVKRPKEEHVSKPENQTRVSCIVPSPDPYKPSFFVGFPTCFSEYNVIEGRTVSSAYVHENDWVYCIHPLEASKLLVVVGCTIGLWQKTAAEWRRTSVLQSETKKRGKQRDFISALVPLQPHQVASGSFYGSIKILDLTQGKIERGWNAERGKIWALETLSPHTLASGGDEGVVRLWDVRTDKPQHELRSPGGAISALLRLDETLLVAGSCPPDPLRNGGATLSFYDIRK